MAIKIDLLPGHVQQRRILERTVMLSVLSLALVGTGLVMALDAKQKELATAQENLAVATAVSDKTTAAEGVKTAAITAAQPINDTVTFMLVAGKSGPQRAALLNQVRQYIYIDTVVKTIDLSDGANAIVQASVKNPTQYAQFLFNLRRAGPPAVGETTTDAGPLFATAPKAPAAPGAATGAAAAPGSGAPQAAAPQAAAPQGGGATQGGGAYNVNGFGSGATEFVLPATPTDQPVIIQYPLNVVLSGPLKYPIPVIPDPTVVGVAATGAQGGAAGAPVAAGAPAAQGQGGI